MRIGFRVKEILAVTALTALVAVGAGLLHFAQLTRIVVEEGMGQAELVARQLFAQSSRALERTPARGAWEALHQDAELRALLEASVGYSPHLQYALIADDEGEIRLHGEPYKEGGQAADRQTLASLLEVGPVSRTVALYRPGRVYEVRLPLRLGRAPFGTIRLGVSNALLRQELEAALLRGLLLLCLALPLSWIVALGLTRLSLRPIHRITVAMDQARRGELVGTPDLGGEDEFRELASQLELLGKEVQADRLRAVGEEDQILQVADHLEDGMVFLHRDRRILFMNTAAERVIGAPLSWVRGKSLAEVVPAAHPLRGLLARAFETPEGIRNATVWLPLTEESREFLVSAFTVADAHTPVGAVVLLRDLGSLQTLRSLLSYSAKLAALGRLTSGVAHEVKNPLNAMAIHLELLRGRLHGAPDEVRESLKVIDGEIQRLDRVVQGFLKFVRPQELRLASLDLNSHLGEVIALLQPEWESKGIRFSFEPAAGLLPVTADAELLRQACLNLMLNACQAMPSGGEVRVGTTHEAGWAVIRITDTGSGIAPEDLEKIFRLYYTTKPGGSGIGLAMVYRTVQLHDGSIDVQSELDQGTTVTIRLPLG
ncbi:MAG: PAS domain-containing protein [candidate division NC10 bacterium]|nr:PAS domain-containing protein [candidate division NC10 bacterium]